MTLRTRFDMRALGRLKAGAMNKTEQQYAEHLEYLKSRGDVLWYRFEGIKLRLADKTFLTPDFAVMKRDGVIELHDVKGGYIFEDAKVKLKVAADQYPFEFVIVKKDRSGIWALQAIGSSES